MRLSTIGRPLDFRYKTNRAIAAIFLASAIVFLCARLWQGGPVLPAAESAGLAALSVFLTWAIGREIDPDKDLSAFVAVALSLPVLCLYEARGTLAIFWLLLALRMLNRTTGAPATVLDLLVVVGLGVWLSLEYGAGIGVLTAAAFLANFALDSTRASSVLALVAAGSIVAINLELDSFSRHLRFVIAAIALSVAFVPVVIRCKTMNSVGDLSGKPLDARRVQASQLFAVAAGLYFAVGFGLDGLLVCLPAWASLVGATLWWALETVGAIRPSARER